MTRNLQFWLTKNNLTIFTIFKLSLHRASLPFFQENLKSLIPRATQSRNCYFALNGRPCDALIVRTTRSGVLILIGSRGLTHAWPNDPMWRRNRMVLVFDTRSQFSPPAINFLRLTGRLPRNTGFYVKNPILKSFIIVSRHFHGVWIDKMKATCKFWIVVFLKSFEPWTRHKNRFPKITPLRVVCGHLAWSSFRSIPKPQLEICGIVATDIGFIDLLVFVGWYLFTRYRLCFA